MLKKYFLILKKKYRGSETKSKISLISYWASKFNVISLALRGSAAFGAHLGHRRRRRRFCYKKRKKMGRLGCPIWNGFAGGEKKNRSTYGAPNGLPATAGP